MTGNRKFRKGLAIAPGLLFAAFLLAGCGERPAGDPEAGGLCLAETTPISAIQGSGYHSPLDGTRQAVSGIITAIDPERGFYIESDDRAPPGHSRGLFVSDHGLAKQAQRGQRWVLVGDIEETGSRRDKLTTLTSLASQALCEEAQPLPLTAIGLPLDNPGREALEGMRVAFDRELFVTDVYSQYRGELTLSVGGPLRSPTEVAMPGKEADSIARDNRERAIDVLFGDETDMPLPTGSGIHDLVGVLGHDGRDQLLLAEDANTEATPLPAEISPPAQGQLRVVNINLLNFFNGDGRGGGFPTERGAESLAEFRAQQGRTSAALAAMRPDLLAVQELENDGFGPDSAAASLLELLDDADNGGYAVVRRDENRIGGDVITVGLFYREAALEPVGPSYTLDSGPFRELSRQPLAQLFREKESGDIFLAAVNHLKSKGGCPDSGDDPNANHGQGCWNRARTAAVDALLAWLEGLARESGTDRILVLGDMNAYRMEDPVRKFADSGFTELVEQQSGLPEYSHRYFGQAGTLDYAFASAPLAQLASQAMIWHINADWPRNMDLPQPWLRMSDHDPVIVDFDFSQNP